MAAVAGVVRVVSHKSIEDNRVDPTVLRFQLLITALSGWLRCVQADVTAVLSRSRIEHRLGDRLRVIRSAATTRVASERRPDASYSELRLAGQPSFPIPYATT